MIRPQDLHSYLQAAPFRPFSIRMNSGRTFDIRHPEMVKVGAHSIIVFTFVNDDPAIYDRWDTVSLVLIETLSFTESQAA